MPTPSRATTLSGADSGSCSGTASGHGIGLEVHEAPRLATTADGALAEGAVVTIEPGIYRPGWGGVRIEDDVVLGGGRAAQILTRVPARADRARREPCAVTARLPEAYDRPTLREEADRASSTSRRWTRSRSRRTRG